MSQKPKADPEGDRRVGRILWAVMLVPNAFVLYLWLVFGGLGGQLIFWATVGTSIAISASFVFLYFEKYVEATICVFLTMPLVMGCTLWGSRLFPSAGT